MRTCRRVFGWSRAQSTTLVIGSGPGSELDLVIGVDFSGGRRLASRADAVLTLVEPASVLDAAELLVRRGLAPDAWLLARVDELPYSTASTADFLVELCRVAETTVHVTTDGGERTTSARFVAHLRRSAAKARRRRLSPSVRVLCSGRDAHRQAKSSNAIETTAPFLPHIQL